MNVEELLFISEQEGLRISGRGDTKLVEISQAARKEPIRVLKVSGTGLFL